MTMDVASLVGGVALGFIGGFIVCASIFGKAVRSVDEVVEELERKMKSLGVDSLLEKLSGIRTEVRALDAEAKSLGDKLFAIWKRVEELDQHLENIESIVSKKIRYVIEIKTVEGGNHG